MLPDYLMLIGYAFLLFQEESSVQALIDACIEEDGKLYLCVSSPTIKDKPVSRVIGEPSLTNANFPQIGSKWFNEKKLSFSITQFS